MDFLKGIICDELLTRLSEELNNQENVKLVNLKDGNYISKAKYNNALDKIMKLKTQLTKCINELEELKQKVNTSDRTEKKINDIKNIYENNIESLQREVLRTKKMLAIDLAISKSGSIDDVAVKAHLKDYVDAGELNELDNISGLDNGILKLKKKCPYLFDSDSSENRVNI